MSTNESTKEAEEQVPAVLLQAQSGKHRKSKAKKSIKKRRMERIPTSFSVDRKQNNFRFVNSLTVNKWDVPEFLRKGKYYQELFPDDDREDGNDLNADAIPFVPLNCRKVNTTVENVSDLGQLLRTLRFWVVEVLPSDVVQFCLVSEDSAIASVLEEFKCDFPIVGKLRDFCTCKHMGCDQRSANRFLAAAAVGSIDALKELTASMVKQASRMLYSKRGEFFWKSSSEPAWWAARRGHLDCLTFLCELGCKLDKEVSEAAVEGGHVDCWLYLTTIPRYKSILNKKAALYLATDAGQFPMMNLLHDQEQPWPSNLLESVVQNGHLHCLRSMSAHPRGCEWTAEVTHAAFDNQRMDCLSHAVQCGCPVDVSDLECAAMLGRFDFLKILHTPGVYLPPAMLVNAAAAGNLPCMEYAHKQGCVWTTAVTVQAASAGHLDCLRYAHEHDCEWDAAVTTAAASQGRLMCLSYAHEQGCPWEAKLTLQAAYAARWDCVLYAAEHGCPVHATCACLAAGRCDADCLGRLFDCGAQPDSNILVAAAAAGSLPCLKCGNAHGCLWVAEVTKAAVTERNLSCLQYALQMNCPIHPDCLHNAASRGTLPFVQCLVESGAVINECVVVAAVRSGHVVCLQYLLKQQANILSQAAFRAAIDHCQLECLVLISQQPCMKHWHGWAVGYAEQKSLFDVNQKPAMTLVSLRRIVFAVGRPVEVRVGGGCWRRGIVEREPYSTRDSLSLGFFSIRLVDNNTSVQALPVDVRVSK